MQMVWIDLPQPVVPFNGVLDGVPSRPWRMRLHWHVGVPTKAWECLCSQGTGYASQWAIAFGSSGASLG